MRNQRTIPSVCEQCGKPFLAFRQNAKRGASKYCSRACSDLNMPGREQRSLAERFAEKYIVDEHGCWIWQGAISNKGYGRIWVCGEERRSMLAHRVSYGLFVGPIPEGAELDHLCRNTRCVNPSHLEPVLHAVNFQRGMAPTAIVFRTGMCGRGHDMSGENVYVHAKTGKRQCRECRRIRRREASTRRKHERG